MLHYIRIPFQVQAETGKAAARTARAASPARRAGGIFPCAPGGPNDWIYVFARPTGPLAPPPQGAGPRGPDRRPALRDAGRARRARGEVNADGRRLHPPARQARGDALIGGAGVPAGAVLDTMELINEPSFTGAAFCSGRPPVRRLQDARLAGPLRRQAAQAEAGAAARPAHAEVLGDWLGMSEGDVEALKKEGAI